MCRHRKTSGCCATAFIADELLLSAGCEGNIDLNIYELLLERESFQATVSYNNPTNERTVYQQHHRRGIKRNQVKK